MLPQGPHASELCVSVNTGVSTPVSEDAAQPHRCCCHRAAPAPGPTGLGWETPAAASQPCASHGVPDSEDLATTMAQAGLGERSDLSVGAWCVLVLRCVVLTLGRAPPSPVRVKTGRQGFRTASALGVRTSVPPESPGGGGPQGESHCCGDSRSDPVSVSAGTAARLRGRRGAFGGES